MTASPSPLWHPFTQHALEPPMRRAVSAEGAIIIDADGRRIVDAISSWWVITHSHRHPTITAAIRDAAEKLDQVIFAEFTHDAAETLARGLLAVAPPGLAHVFLSDSGSTAVEVALKMALGTFHNRGEARTRVCVLEDGYHGDTIGTMSTGERGVFNRPYEPLLFAVERLPFPSPDRAQETLYAFERAARAGDVAALLIEPLVLGAGGMRMYAPHVLQALAEIAARHGVLVIADEVMTGWGRTGTLFACEQAGITPDILCTSKGLTGGSLPLAATLCRPEIFAAHWSTDRARTFFHSSSFTANPIACAAAVANLEVWRTEPVAEHVASLAARQAAHLARLEGDPRFRDVRRLGTIAALDLTCDRPGYLAEVGPRLRAFFRSRDLLVRQLGNVLYLMPPDCIDDDDLARLWAAIDEAADLVAGGNR